ncbi:VOC family protein [soil metagenome]
MQKLTPFLWFDTQADEAVNFYTSLLDNTRIRTTTRYTDKGQEIHGMDGGTVMTVDFELAGQRFTALNGGPHFQFNPGISFFVQLDAEPEVDRVWNEMIKEGQAMMPLDKYDWSEKYGWLQDRYGLTWQISLGTKEHTGGQVITPSLMFVGDQHGRAEEAINHYISIFKNSEIEGILRWDGKEGPDPEGTVKHAQFYLEGQAFMAMESAHDHQFGFNESISFVVNCESDEEVDYYWEKLKEGGDSNAQQCGWLKDEFGISWQVVPTEMKEMLRDDDPEKVKRVTSVMLKMKKLDLKKLREAYEG